MIYFYFLGLTIIWLLTKRILSFPAVSWLILGLYATGAHEICSDQVADCKTLNAIWLGMASILAALVSAHAFCFYKRTALPALLPPPVPVMADIHTAAAQKNAIMLCALLLIILGGIFSVYGLFFFWGKSGAADVERFLIRQIPMFGLMLRVIFFSLPALCVVVIYDYARVGIHPIFLWLLCLITLVFCALSGSKQSALTAAGLFALAIFYGGYRLKIWHYVAMAGASMLIIALTLFVVMFLVGLHNPFAVIPQLLYRATAGAAEGLYNIVDGSYAYYKGFGYGWYTLVKPIYTLGATLRFLGKGPLAGDSGYLISSFYRGPDLQTGYTYSIVGHGYLEGGIAGVVIICFLYGLVLAFVDIKAGETSRLFTRYKAFWVSTGWGLIILSDWGFFDGWLIYGFFNIVLVFVLLYLFEKLFMPVQLSPGHDSQSLYGG